MKIFTYDPDKRLNSKQALKHPFFYEMYKRDKRIMHFAKKNQFQGGSFATPQAPASKPTQFPYLAKAKDAEFNNCIPLHIFKEHQTKRKKIKMKIKNTSIFYKILLNKKQIKKKCEEDKEEEEQAPAIERS
jgi:hypothetical protein